MQTVRWRYIKVWGKTTYSALVLQSLYVSRERHCIFLSVKRFLISPIIYEGSTLINFCFLMKKYFWHLISILDFTGLNVWITQSSKCRKINAIKWILRKISNPIKLKTVAVRLYTHQLYTRITYTKTRHRNDCTRGQLYTK